MYKLIFWLFKKQMIKLAFDTQRKPDKFIGHEFVFADSEGNRYYEPLDLMNSGLKRKAQLLTSQAELSAAMTGEEQDLFFDAIEMAINGKINKGQLPDFAAISFIIKEVRDRRNNIIHPDIVFDIVGLYFIREDENPNEFDVQIHNEKIKQFKKDYNVLSFFLKGDNLEKLLGFKSMSKEELEHHLNKSVKKVEALKRLLKNYISENELSPKEKTLINSSIQSAEALKEKSTLLRR